MDVLNKYCPRSGKAVVENSLAEYRKHTVGFCNPGCRDSFQGDPKLSPKDCHYFDVLIKERE